MSNTQTAIKTMLVADALSIARRWNEQIDVDEYLINLGFKVNRNDHGATHTVVLPAGWTAREPIQYTAHNGMYNSRYQATLIEDATGKVRLISNLANPTPMGWAGSELYICEADAAFFQGKLPEGKSINFVTDEVIARFESNRK